MQTVEATGIEGSLADRVWRFLGFIRFSHTIFAMPFALGSMFVAAGGLPSLWTTVMVVLAMIFARTAAMSFNRLADWEIDKRNPRTAGRHRLVTRPTAITGCVAASVAFVVVAALINPLCLYLSPLALGIVFFYSTTKRFTNCAQFFLGLGLAVAPVGAWLAVTGHFNWPPLVLAVGVLLWVAGFDMIYATQDYEIDRREGLHSMVVWLGPGGALAFARYLHAGTWFALVGFGLVAHLGWPYFVAQPIVLGLLIHEHWMARSRDVEAINRAFFHANAWIGLIFVTAILVDVLT